jgi:hypothetical protein
MNDKLKDVSIEDMQKEIKRRLTTLPKVNSNIDWSPIINMVKNEIISNTVKDYEHYLFEAVMEAMFGVDIWEWWNNRNSEAQSNQ